MNPSTPPPFPLSALVGQEELKLALLLHGVDPRLGGVLIRGEKGSGKSTAARGLAALLPGSAPFVELPVGATEDRVVGSLDLEEALVEGRRRLQPGLLAAAHQGVLYVDEVNLLPDHLVDLLIDAAAFGVNRVERDGLAVEHESRFVLVGSMNPEEGELRPQLLDRFGLAVEVRAPTDPELRAEAVRRRLAYDADPAAFAARYEAEEREVAAALAAGAGLLPGVTLPDEVLTLAARLCAELGAEGLRADLVLSRGARALAAFEGRRAATGGDVTRLAALALAHRRRRGPLDAPGLDPQELADALDRLERAGHDDGTGDAGGDGNERDGSGNDTAGAGAGEDPSQPPAAPGRTPPVRPAAGVPLALTVTRPSGALGRRARGQAARGGVVAGRAPDDGGAVTDLALGATVTAAAARRALAPAPGNAPLERADLRQAVREARTAHLVILAVDASGSMGSTRRMEAAKGAALSLLVDAYQRRDRVALVTFAGEDASVALRPTGSVEVARARLGQLPTGGRTPLAAGLGAALEVARTAGRTDPGRRPVLVLVTDGRATAPLPDPAGAALAAATQVARAGIEALVVDAEDGDIRLGLARTLAEAMGAAYVALPELAAEPLARVVTDLVAADE
ncbi:MAG TPA: VWA domain-containing protein [Acidimicrobiia bacterium]|jgi:magnesium chelatase subunit D